MSFNIGISTGIATGVAISTAMNSSLRRRSSSIDGESTGSKLFSILNAEFEREQKRNEEERMKKQENNKERNLKLKEDVYENEAVSEEVKAKLLVMDKFVDIAGFYVPDINDPIKTYSRIYRDYELKYYDFQGTYRCVAWRGDILNENRVEELKSNIEVLNGEIESLESDLIKVGHMRFLISNERFGEIDYSQYAKNIRPEIIELICVEAKDYIYSILDETFSDISRCQFKARACVREAKFTLEKNQENIEKNQENIEKTLKYKALNFFKKKK